MLKAVLHFAVVRHTRGISHPYAFAFDNIVYVDSPVGVVSWRYSGHNANFSPGHRSRIRASATQGDQSSLRKRNTATGLKPDLPYRRCSIVNFTRRIACRRRRNRKPRGLPQQRCGSSSAATRSRSCAH